MNKESRNRLRKVVAQARTLLEEDVRTQLNRFGIEEGGNTVPIGRLSYLGSTDAELRDKILASINKEQGKRIELSEAYDRYVRHVGFTYLNRVAALRAMEVRDLLEKETVIQRDKYAGLSERAYEISERQGVSNSGESTRCCFLEAFGEVSQEIKVLFDANDEYSVLFPSAGVLEKVIQLISVDVPEANWREEDIIGWIYQYYNSEAREELRKTRHKLRADDVPVLNQFYTSHWLVRALVDNTLGRLWLEMKGRMPKPGGGMAPSPEHLRNPNGDKVDGYCSYIIPSRREPPPREHKPVRDIKVLDPACGSGHFLVYAFNVLYRMYLEEEPQTPKGEIPRLILENNLFGVDIDLRSVQLAALSLYLKAKEYNCDMKITKMNLVCADVRMINGDLKKAFLKRLEPDVDLQKIFIKLFEELEYTFDIGSLLKVRTPFERLIAERGPQSHFQIRPSGQSSFSRRGLTAQTSIRFEEHTESTTIQPAITLKDMLEALISFEKEGLEKRDMGSMLFAVEAEKSVGLLTLLSQKYDVVVMNPPYGELPESTKNYAKIHYPHTYTDYYAAFIEQGVENCEENGFVGTLTGRTFMFLKSLEKVRSQILFENAFPEFIIDLNASPSDNILDEATCRWAATVIRKSSDLQLKSESTFIRLTLVEGEDNKIAELQDIISILFSGNQHNLVYTIESNSFKKMPFMPYSYWTPPAIMDLFIKYPPLDKENAFFPTSVQIANIKSGTHTSDDCRFTRYFWEVNAKTIGKGKRWAFFPKGGEGFYSDNNLVIDWANDGKEIKEYPLASVRNESWYFNRGICWPDIVSSVWINFRILPESVLSKVVNTLFPIKKEFTLPLISFGNSSLSSFLLFSLDPLMHHRAIGYVAQLPIAMELLESKELAKLSERAHDSLKEWDSGNETSTVFTMPWLLQTVFSTESHSLKAQGISDGPQFENESFLDLADICRQREFSLRKEILTIRKQIDDQLFKIYSISERDREIINRELSIIGKLINEDLSQENVKSKISANEHILRLVSYYVKKIMEEQEEGVVLFDLLANRIRENIAKDFGEDINVVETELLRALGESIESWLVNDFFNFHMGLYERRPIFWHLTSLNFSVKKRSSGIFNCLLYYHKLDKDTIPKIRTRQEYLKGILDGAKWRVEGLRRELQKEQLDRKRENRLQEEYENAQEEYLELQAFDQKLAEVSNPRAESTKLDKHASWVLQKIVEVRDNGWNPVIDYGVRVNIEPLKEARLLHPAADRVK